MFIAVFVPRPRSSHIKQPMLGALCLDALFELDTKTKGAQSTELCALEGHRPRGSASP